MFTDLVGSTAFAAEHGEGAADEVRRYHLRRARMAADANNGTMVKGLGDGSMLAFPAADDAVRAAIALVDDTDGPEHPGIRVGIATGRPVREEDDYFGISVVTASRLCDRASTNQILVSAATEQAALGAGFEFSSVGSLILKGLADPVTAFEVRFGDRSLQGVAPTALEVDAGGELPLPTSLARADESFFGRTSDLRWLASRFDVARQGIPQFVVLEGPAGMGKTALASAFARRAHGDGAAVLFGACDSDVSYGPFTDALRTYASQVGEDVMSRHLIGRGAELHRLLNHRDAGEVSERHGADRVLLFDAVLEWLSLLGATRPVVLVIDDLHSIDGDSVALLRRLIRNPPDAQLLAIATVRNDLVDPTLLDRLDDLRRSENVHEHSVRGLTDADIGSFVSDWVDGDVTPDVVARLREDTGGNPHFVRELLRALDLDDQELVSASRLLHALAEAELPRTITGLLERRLTMLGERCREFLDMASVLGAEFDVRILHQLTGETVASILRDLESAVAIGILRESHDHPGRLRFDHDLARRSIYERIGLGRRTDLHARAALIFDRLADMGEASTTAAALHYVAAGPMADSNRAATLCERAGDDEMGGLAYEHAAARFEQALTVLGTPPPSEAVRLLHKQGAALLSAHRIDEGRKVLRRAADLAEGAGLAEELAQVSVSFPGFSLSAAGLRFGEIDHEAIALFDRATAALGKSDHPELARVLAVRAVCATFLPSDDRVVHADEAVAMARRLGGGDLLAYVLPRAAIARLGPDHIDQSLADISEAAETSGHQLRGGLTEMIRVCALDARGDGATAYEHFRRVEEEIAQSPDPYDRSWQLWVRAAMACLAGAFDDAEAYANRGFESATTQTGQLSGDQPTVGAVALYAAQIGMIRWNQGRLGELGPVLSSFAHAVPAMPVWQAATAAAWAAGGDHARARAIVREADFADPPRNLLWATTMLMHAFAIYELRDEASARRLLPEIEPYRSLGSSVLAAVQLGSLARGVGHAADAAGDYDLALSSFEEAVAADRRLEAPALEAYSQVMMAGTLLRRKGPGDIDRAEAILADVGPTAEAYGYGAATRAIGQLDELRPSRRVHAPRLRALSRDRATQTWRRGVTRSKAAVTGALQYSVSRISDGRSDIALERRVDGRGRLPALIRAVALSFMPERAFGFTGVIGFTLTYSTPGLGSGAPEQWYIVVDDRRAHVHEGPAPDPDLVVYLSVADFVRFVAGDLGTVGALLDGKVRVDGSLELASRIPGMFGGREP